MASRGVLDMTPHLMHMAKSNPELFATVMKCRARIYAGKAPNRYIEGLLNDIQKCHGATQMHLIDEYLDQLVLFGDDVLKALEALPSSAIEQWMGHKRPATTEWTFRTAPASINPPCDQ